MLIEQVAAESTRIPTRVGGTRRGGARSGAGRKPKPDAMVTVAFVLHRDQIAWIEAQALDQQISKSGVVRAVIQEHRAEHALKPKRP